MAAGPVSSVRVTTVIGHCPTYPSSSGDVICAFGLANSGGSAVKNAWHIATSSSLLAHRHYHIGVVLTQWAILSGRAWPLILRDKARRELACTLVHWHWQLMPAIGRRPIPPREPILPRGAFGSRHESPVSGLRFRTLIPGLRLPLPKDRAAHSGSGVRAGGWQGYRHVRVPLHQLARQLARPHGSNQNSLPRKAIEAEPLDW